MEPKSILTYENLKILCPACRTGHLDLTSANSEVHCSVCDASYQMKNGIIDLLPDSPHQEHIFGGAIESEWFVRFYESRWWRRGLVNNLYLAISFDDELEMISQAATLKDARTVLDLACGSGIYTRPFARTLDQGIAVGLDLSMPMLDYAAAKAETEGISNTLFIHGDAHHLPFPDNQFDVVNCSGALHVFPDLPKVLSEVHRVLTPGGYFTGGIGRWPWQGKFGSKFRDWYKRRAGIQGFYLEELEAYFREAGLVNIVCHYEKRAWFIMSAMKPQ